MIFFNGARFIDEAIRSVVDQDGCDEWELILVDDGSTDESTAIAVSWAARDPRIRYLDHPGHENRGMSASRNVGVEHSSGRYVTFLDCDDIFLPSNYAHRIRVAAALPDADVIVSAVWWWHTWQGPDVASPPDFPLLLPEAPRMVILDPPRLFAAIYGTPGGAHAPAICGLLIRREALQAIGGLQPEFTGMYEDQVLNVKAGLKLRAAIDPRPLSLYRQHPDSACAVALANGDWRRSAPSRTQAQFHAWTRDYVGREAGVDSEEWQIVMRDIQHSLDGPDPFGPGLRGALRRHVPGPLKAQIRRVRRLAARREPPVSVIAMWSEQFLSVTTSFASGTAIVLLPPAQGGGPWTGDIPDSAFGPGVALSRYALGDEAGGRFDFVVVPFETSASVSSEELFDVIGRRLRVGGAVAAVVPGPAWRPRDGARAPRDDADALQRLAQQRFPGMRVSVETFGNDVTARAVADGLVAGDVQGVGIDHHDPDHQVMLALSVAPPERLIAALDSYRPIAIVTHGR
jgi:hypothetical protein